MSSKLFDLSGRTALITGSTRGLGNALAQGLAEASAASDFVNGQIIFVDGGIMAVL